MRKLHHYLAWLVLCIVALPTHAAKRDKTSAYVAPLGYRLAECDGTGSKPQSKLWFHDNSFWCVLDMPEGDEILELVGDHWQSRQVLSESTRIKGRSDVLWDGGHLVVLVCADTPSLFEFDYDATARRYNLRPGFPLPLDIAPDSETLVIDEDSTGRLWVAYSASGKVYVTHSRDDHLHWDLPGQVLRDNTSDDDISSVIAFANHIGVFWSDQERDEFCFRVRADSTPPEHWEPREVVESFPDCADDHVNLAADRAGFVYAATKDDDNRLCVHMRTPSGEWTSNPDVLETDVTRPIVMTADDDSLLVVLFTRWHQGLDTIGYCESALGTLDFGAPKQFIAVPAVNLNNVSGTKRSLPAGQIVALADGADAAWWNLWTSGEESDDEINAERSRRLQAHPLAPCSTAVLALAFDEGVGSATADAAAGGVGVLGGPWAKDFAEPSWTEGISGSALRFDGKHQFLSVSPGAPLAITGSVTMECWFRAWPLQRKQVLLSGRNFYLHLQHTGAPKFSWDEVHGKNHTVKMKQAIADTLWHHLAYVYDALRHESRLYLDGHLGSAAPDSERVIKNPDTFFVGMRMKDRVVSEMFLGCIDQVQITADARYVDDFVPQRTFDVTGTPITFLQWTPRSHRDTEVYDLFRRVGPHLEQLNVEPLHRTFFYDTKAPDALAHYELTVHPLGLPSSVPHGTGRDGQSRREPHQPDQVTSTGSN